MRTRSSGSKQVCRSDSNVRSPLIQHWRFWSGGPTFDRNAHPNHADKAFFRCTGCRVLQLKRLPTKPEPDSFWMSAEHNMRPVFDCLSLGCEGIRRITKTRCPIFLTARDRNQAILLDPFILRPSFGKLIEVDLELVDPSR